MKSDTAHIGVRGTPDCIEFLFHGLSMTTPKPELWVQHKLFFDAARTGRLGALNARLAAHPDWGRLVNEEGLTPLLLAVSQGHMQCVQALLPYSDVAAVDHKHNSALMLAAIKGNVAILEALLAGGADPRLQNAEGHTALMLAVSFGHLDATRLLVPLSPLEAQSHKDGKNALFLALRSQDTQCVELLLPFCTPALLAQRNRQGRTALMDTVAYGSQAALQSLIGFADASATHASLDLEGALVLCAQGDPPNPAHLQTLLNSTGPIEPQALARALAAALSITTAPLSSLLENVLNGRPLSRSGPVYLAFEALTAPAPASIAPLLWHALVHGREHERALGQEPERERAARSLQAALDPTIDPEGNTLFHLAARQGVIHQLPGMLEQCAPDGRNANGETVLMLAAAQGDPEQLQCLLEQPGFAAGVRATDLRGRNAFMHAAAASALPTLQLLLPLSPLGACDNRGDTALAMNVRTLFVDSRQHNPVSFSQSLPCTRYLLPHRAEHVANPLQTPLLVALQDLKLPLPHWQAAALQEIEAADPLLEAGAYDASALFLALKSRRSVLCHRLLPFAARRPTPNGQTALMLAVQADEESHVRTLLDHCDPLALDVYGMSALMLAASCNHETLVSLLLPVSDPFQCNLDGDTALMLALRDPDSDCIPALVSSAASLPSLDGDTALMLAILNHPDQVDTLLPHSDAHARNAQGQTPLMLAVSLGNTRLVELLVPCSDAAARDHQGRLAVDYAFANATSPLGILRGTALRLVEILAGATPREAFIRAWIPHQDRIDFQAPQTPPMPHSRAIVERHILAGDLVPGPSSATGKAQAGSERADSQQQSRETCVRESASASSASATATPMSRSPRRRRL